MDTDNRVEILEHAIELLTQAGELVALLDDRFLDAHVLPQLQGQEGGWLGEHAIDHLRNALPATRHPKAADALQAPQSTCASPATTTASSTRKPNGSTPTPPTTTWPSPPRTSTSAAASTLTDQACHTCWTSRARAGSTGSSSTASTGSPARHTTWRASCTTCSMPGSRCTAPPSHQPSRSPTTRWPSSACSAPPSAMTPRYTTIAPPAPCGPSGDVGGEGRGLHPRVDRRRHTSPTR
jgi:hypothetical protein